MRAQQVIGWSVAALGVVGFFVVFGPALVPFVLGLVGAYLLDPPARWLQRRGFSRGAAVAAIALALLTLIGGALMAVGPVLVVQIDEVIRRFPGWVEQLEAVIAAHVPEDSDVVDDALSLAGEQAGETGSMLLRALFSGGQAVLNAIGLLVIAPIVAVYLLLDWQRMVRTVDRWLPRAQAPVVRRIAGDMNRALGGFLRGQLTVMLILGIFYAVALTVVGMPFGLLVGLIAGLLCFIPIVGAWVGGVLFFLVALVGLWGDPVRIALVGAVFFIGQLVEGNYLVPKLVGNSIGLHPVWLLFAMTALGSAMGFMGLVIAVPLAGVLAVLVRFGLERYRAGQIRLGDTVIEPDDPDGTGSPAP